MLFFPPFWQPMMPHLALPALTAALRANGRQVIQRDLNVETFDYLLSRTYLDAVVRRLPQDRKRLTKAGAGKPWLKGALQEIDWGLRQGSHIASKVDAAKRVVRSAAFYDGERGQPASATLNDGLHLASLPFYPAALTFSGYESPYPMDATPAILAAVRDGDTNIFRSLFAERVIPDIRRERPDVVGISLTCQHQVIAAFTLAQMIKEAGLRPHIVLGGKMITCWQDILPERPALFALCDSAIYHEGETALLRLLDALDGNGDLADVPNLIYRSGDHIVRNEPGCWLDVNSLPAPDFDGLPLDLYLAPERVLPVSASRGCYWRRCAFCNVGYGESHAFRERPAARVAAEMQALATRHNVQRFFFADEALSPRMFRGLSGLLPADTPLRWACCARFDPGINASLLQHMHAAGCVMLLYGLEAGAQRVLDLIGKGTSLPVAARILSDGTAAGIWNHVFLFFGFPGETEGEAQETMAFVQGNAAGIHSICTGTFLLEKWASISENPERYGITQMRTAPHHDLAFYYDYDVTSGMDARAALAVEEQFIDRLPQQRYGHFYFHDTYRFLYAAHLSGRGPPPCAHEERRGAAMM